MKAPNKFVVARLPKVVERSLATRLVHLTDFLAWALIDARDDFPKLMAQFSAFVSKVQYGQSLQMIQRIRDRANALRKSDESPDLWAAAELEDFATELEEELSQDVEADP